MEDQTDQKMKHYVLIGIILFSGILLEDVYGEDIIQVLENIKGSQLEPSGEEYSIVVVKVEDDSFRTAFGTEEIDDVKIKITNDGQESIELNIKEYGIVYDDGKQQEGLTTTLTTSLPDKYFDWSDPEYINFTLLPEGSATFDLAFEKIDRSSNPKLMVSIVEDPNVEIISTGTYIPIVNVRGSGDEYLLAL